VFVILRSVIRTEKQFCVMISSFKMRIQEGLANIQYIHGSIGNYIKNRAGMLFRSSDSVSRTSPAHDCLCTSKL
jgi:hypothetical protein